MFFTSTTSIQRVSRVGLGVASGDKRWEYAVRTTEAEMCLSPSGWLAMSIVLPDRSVSNGHVDNAAAADYGFSGLLNLDCDTWRLRVSMSDTNDHLVVTLGDTSGVNFAYLDCSDDWNDFDALGIVAIWYTSNGHKYASLWCNGYVMDSIADPATWYPESGPPGTMYIGISDETGLNADCFISHVAYGMDRMSRSTAQVLSRHMGKMARGKNALWEASPGGGGPS